MQEYRMLHNITEYT